MQQHHLLLFILHQFSWEISRLRATFGNCDYTLDNIDNCVLRMGCLQILKVVRITLQIPPTAEYKLYPAIYDSISSNMSKKDGLSLNCCLETLL